MPLTAIVLAAGQGQRMQSRVPKVLHPVGGLPMLRHVLNSAIQAQAQRCVVVYGCKGKQVQQAIRDEKVQWAQQTEPLGTAHAVAQALPLVNAQDTVVVLYGDTPLISAQTIVRLVQAAQGSAQLTVLTFVVQDPSGYGRIIRNTDNQIEHIVEQKDASPQQLMITEVNSGVMLAPCHLFRTWIEQIDSNNRQKEFYLTDCVKIARKQGIPVQGVVCEDANELLGVNDRAQLARVEKIYQQRVRKQLMVNGITLIDPDSTFIYGQIEHGTDVVIEPGVTLKGRVKLGDQVTIESHCTIKNSVVGASTMIHAMTHVEDAEIGEDCEIGPFARIRPGTILDDHVKIGNYVEVKKSEIGRGSKVNHLSYIGDCTMGTGVNIGAGTIVCNYDGAQKHKTIIGDNVFIGSDTQLVAPVTVGSGATIGAGSTITKDAPADTLSLSRSKQVSVENWQRPTKKDKKPDQ